jgi:O2-independent ubiquinone biosynthesis protein UbiV
MGSAILKLALGPIQYYWPRATVLEFYEAVAAMPVDVVYLGETVCSRRHELRLPDWLAIAEQLAAAGKEVVLSTQALLESKTDMAMLQRITGNGRFLVEANDIGAAHLLAGKLPFVAGPYLNIYNAPTLRLMAELGAKRWVMPIEMSREGLMQVLRDDAPLIETEVFAYGRMPLAFSARCFTARHHNLPKDDCRFTCLQYPDGLVMKTREGDHFLALNGIQTQSALVYNLVREIAAMPAAGVDLIRISPQHQHMQQLVALFRAVLDADMAGNAALAEMADLMPDDACDGYWHGKSGLERIVA